MPISSPESIRLGGNEDFLAHPPPLGNGKFSCQSSCILHRYTAVRTLATQKMWQPIEHLAIIAAGHATSWCDGHHTQGGPSVLLRPSISRVQAPASETSARQSSEYGLLLRPSFVSAGMAVERAARWATPASAISIPAAGDEQADLGVARAGFSELQSLEQQQRLPLFLCARAGGVAWRVPSP